MTNERIEEIKHLLACFVDSFPQGIKGDLYDVGGGTYIFDFVDRFVLINQYVVSITPGTLAHTWNAFVFSALDGLRCAGYIKEKEASDFADLIVGAEDGVKQKAFQR